MNRGFTAELRRIVFLILGCVFFGLNNGYLEWTLIVGGGLYMAWMLWQIYRLDHWLSNTRNGTPPEASGIWGDVFDRVERLQKRQKREKRRLQGVVKRGQEITAAIPDGIVLLDRQGNIDWFNGVAAELLSLRQQDHGHPLINYVRHPNFIDYMESGNFQEPLDLPSPQSRAIHLQYQVSYFGQGDSLIVVRNITRLYKLEQVRKDFVANVSHELRTPLTVIRGYVESLEVSPGLNDIMKRALSQMAQQSARMTNLINDLLVLSKLETEESELTHDEVSLRPLLQQVQQDAETLSGDSGHKIQLSCPPELVLSASQQELHSAFSNLVFNAVKYTADETEVSIAVTYDSSSVQVAIKDLGDGIEGAHLPRLTERFYRVDEGRNSESGGTGLGLAIVKHIMERHGGRLEISSQLGKGSTFACVFPIQRLLKHNNN